MRLFHFSDDPNIAVFEPRPVLVPSKREPGREWLNGPLVWAIDELRQPMYLFPRDCPRILLWQTRHATPEDIDRFWGESEARMIAYVEESWLERIRAAHIHRYELPDATFEDLNDAGMWVSRVSVTPKSVTKLTDLPHELEEHDVELRAVESLLPLRDVWSTSLHASGIRLRHAMGWGDAP